MPRQLSYCLRYVALERSSSPDGVGLERWICVVASWPPFRCCASVREKLLLHRCLDWPILQHHLQCPQRTELQIRHLLPQFWLCLGVESWSSGWLGRARPPCRCEAGHDGTVGVSTNHPTAQPASPIHARYCATHAPRFVNTAAGDCTERTRL